MRTAGDPPSGRRPGRLGRLKEKALGLFKRFEKHQGEE